MTVRTHQNSPRKAATAALTLIAALGLAVAASAPVRAQDASAANTPSAATAAPGKK